MAGKQDWRGAHQRFIKQVRDEHEKRTGHTPTDAEQRHIENKAEGIAKNAQRLEEKKKK